MARSVLTSNITLQFLFHPNVFSDPEAEAARIVQLLHAAANATDRKEAFKQTFPIYASENRNIGKVHPPLPEIPGILDQFWDGAMEEYRKIFRIRNPEDYHRKLKDVVRLVIADERRKKLERLRLETEEAKDTVDVVSREIPAKPDIRRSRSSDRKTVTALNSKRSATWDAFVNSSLVNRLQGKRPNRSNPPNVDGSDSIERSRANSNASIETQATDSDLIAILSSVPSSQAGAVETSIADLDGAADERDVFYDVEDLAQKATDTNGMPSSRHRIEFSYDSDVPCEALRRMRFAKDGSFEAFISVDESNDGS
jgi:hypothetical protein